MSGGNKPEEETTAMKTMKGPAIFLAQFAGDKAPFNSLKSIAEWAGSLESKGLVLVPVSAAMRSQRQS